MFHLNSIRWISIALLLFAVGCAPTSPPAVDELASLIHTDNLDRFARDLEMDSIDQFTADSTSLMSLAVRNGKLDFIDALIEKGADVNIVNRDALARTPIIDAGEGDNPQIVNKLIEAGADVNFQDANGDHALNRACVKGSYEIVKILLKAGSRTDLKSDQADHSITIVQHGWHDHLLDLFVAERKGLHVSTKEEDRLLLSLDRGELDYFKSAIKKELVETTDEAGTTLLGIAAAKNYEGIVSILLDLGADIDAINPGGQTPLARAAYYGNTAIVKQLLKAGANVNLSNARYHVTPLMAAAMGGQVETGSLLLHAGADPALRDAQGRKTALMWASFYNHTAFVKLLKAKRVFALSK
ncbi:MAG: ankyrin repeat domain-containing protein [Bacteroidia bacterium]